MHDFCRHIFPIVVQVFISDINKTSSPNLSRKENIVGDNLGILSESKSFKNGLISYRSVRDVRGNEIRYI